MRAFFRMHTNTHTQMGLSKLKRMNHDIMMIYEYILYGEINSYKVYGCMHATLDELWCSIVTYLFTELRTYCYRVAQKQIDGFEKSNNNNNSNEVLWSASE